MTDLRHRDFSRVLKWLTSRDANGFPIPVWYFGPPGGGKTHMAAQMADEIKVNFLPSAFGPTTTDTRVIGYLAASNGQYVPGLAYDWFKNGGLWFMDELDNCEPSALVSINALLANDRFRFPNGELVHRHRNTYAMAGANTLGTGAQAGFRRQSQDAAARSRWAKVKAEYDESLELKLAQGQQEWAKYVQAVRVAVSRVAKCNVWITPRDTIIGAAALVNGVAPADVVDHLLCELSEDAKVLVLKEVGPFPKPVPVMTISPGFATPSGPIQDLTEVAVPDFWQTKKIKGTKKFRDYE